MTAALDTQNPIAEAVFAATGSALEQQVLASFAGAPDPRFRQVAASLVRHLHAFVREVEPTSQEWMTAIQFLTRTGQISVNGRQEFILLSDVLGVSMLVDAINNDGEGGATPSTVLGPFHVEAPACEPGADLAEGVEGERLFVDIVTTTDEGEPLANALVDVWQSDIEGLYDMQRPELAGEAQLRGAFRTDGDGRLSFWTILPTAYPIPHDGPVGELLQAARRHPWRPAHLHFMISAPGRRTLVTHLFVRGDAYLASDPVFGVKDELVDDFPLQPPGRAPDGRQLDQPWRRLDWTFRIEADR